LHGYASGIRNKNIAESTEKNNNPVDKRGSLAQNKALSYFSCISSQSNWNLKLIKSPERLNGSQLALENRLTAFLGLKTDTYSFVFRTINAIFG
jgi:hypothetical protein